MTLENKIVEERKELVSNYSLNLNKVLKRLSSRRVLPPVEQINDLVKYVTKDLELDIHVFEKIPSLFGYSIENLRLKVEYITEELGLSLDVFEKLPSLFNYSIENIREKVEYITGELGLSLDIYKKFPKLFSYSVEDNLKPKVEYITEELGLGLDVFEKVPILFSFSLNKRIKPRTAFLEKKGKKYSLLNHIVRNDSIFCSRMAKCSLEEYEEFREEYVKNLSLPPN